MNLTFQPLAKLHSWDIGRYLGTMECSSVGKRLACPNSRAKDRAVARDTKKPLHIVPGQIFHLFIVCKSWLEPHPRGSLAAAASTALGGS